VDNLIIIYRPFISIEESAACLSPTNDLHLVGKLHLSKIIKAFLGELDLIDYKDSDIINNNLSVKYYWNNGSPFLADLIAYYRTAKKSWKLNGGGKFDYLEGCWKIIKACEFYGNQAKWTESMSNPHKFALLEREHFWYQRFFCDDPWNIRYRRLIHSNLFEEDGSPRKLQTRSIRKQSYEVSKED